MDENSFNLDDADRESKDITKSSMLHLAESVKAISQKQHMLTEQLKPESAFKVNTYVMNEDERMAIKRVQSSIDSISSGFKNTAYCESYKPFTIKFECPTTIRSALSDFRRFQSRIDSIMQPVMQFQDMYREMLSRITEPLKQISDQIRLIEERSLHSSRRLSRIFSVIEATKKCQYVLWHPVNIDPDYTSPEIDSVEFFMYEFYTHDNYINLNKLIEKCRSAICGTVGEVLYEQSIVSLRNENYHTAIIGFTSILDGLLSTLSDSTETSINKRLNILQENILAKKTYETNSEEVNELYLYLTLFDVIRSYGETAPFSGPEPILLNRHWIMHGRTKREYSLRDCIKVLSMVYGIIALGEIMGKCV